MTPGVQALECLERQGVRRLHLVQRVNSSPIDFVRVPKALLKAFAKHLSSYEKEDQPTRHPPALPNNMLRATKDASGKSSLSSESHPTSQEGNSKRDPNMTIFPVAPLGLTRYLPRARMGVSAASAAGGAEGAAAEAAASEMDRDV